MDRHVGRNVRRGSTDRGSGKRFSFTFARSRRTARNGLRPSRPSAASAGANSFPGRARHLGAGESDCRPDGKFLHEPEGERIGILFPRAGALSRIAARFLESARIAHNDGLAHLGPSAFDDDAWRAWLDLQQSPRLKVLLGFLRVSKAEMLEGASTAEVKELLRRAYGDVLIDHIEIMREYCARQEGSERHAALVRGLEKIQFLPADATLSEFLAQTHRIFLQLGWKERWNEIDRLTRTWAERLRGPFSKNLYLRWLNEVLGAPTLNRDDHGSHPYSRVQLLSYAEAEGQVWSHLIFAGLTRKNGRPSTKSWRLSGTRRSTNSIGKIKFLIGAL